MEGTKYFWSSALERSASFSIDSFELLGTIADDPATLSVLASSPISTIEDLVEAAKDTPGTLTYGSAGVGSAGHIAMLLLEQAAGIKAVNIPYDGTAAVRTALLNGDIKVATANLGEALTFSEGTDWRILGVMASGRVASQPDLPTFAEAGYPVVGGSLRGLGVPKGTPPEIVETLRDRAGEARARLWEHMRRASAALGVDVTSPIVPIVFGSERAALAAAAELLADGFVVPAIRPPTVPPGSSRLRLTLSAAHHADDVDRVCAAVLAARRRARDE